MPLLDQIRQMKHQGFGDSEITQKLKEQGFRDLEIFEAIDQAKIKSAVSPEEEVMQSQISQQPEEYSNEPLPTSEEMQPSIAQFQSQEYQEEQAPAPGEYQEEQASGYNYPAPQTYAPEYQAYQQYQPEMAAETTTEIAEQVAEEKIQKLKREIGNIQELKTTAERRLKNLDDRLKRIEEIIDKLQAAIIGKIGNYGQNLQDIKKEMEMMQESFSKTLPTLIKRHVPISAHKPEKKKVSGKKANIEHYLRR